MDGTSTWGYKQFFILIGSLPYNIEHKMQSLARHKKNDVLSMLQTSLNYGKNYVNLEKFRIMFSKIKNFKKSTKLDF